MFYHHSHIEITDVWSYIKTNLVLKKNDNNNRNKMLGPLDVCMDDHKALQAKLQGWEK